MLWQTWQPVIPAQNVGNLHVVVIHHRRKMVRRKTIRLQNDEVILRGGIPLHVAMEEIIRFDHATCRHFDAHNGGFASGDTCTRIGERILTELPVVGVRNLADVTGPTLGIELFFGLKCVVRLAIC